MGWDLAAPAVMVGVTVAAAAVGSLSGSGTVYLEVTGSWVRTMTAELAANDLALYRFKPTSGAYTTTAPAQTGTLDWVWESHTPTSEEQGYKPDRMFIKILDFTGGGTTLVISKRYISGNVIVQDYKLIPGS